MLIHSAGCVCLSCRFNRLNLLHFDVHTGTDFGIFVYENPKKREKIRQGIETYTYLELFLSKPPKNRFPASLYRRVGDKDEARHLFFKEQITSWCDNGAGRLVEWRSQTIHRKWFSRLFYSPAVYKNKKDDREVRMRMRQRESIILVFS